MGVDVEGVGLDGTAIAGEDDHLKMVQVVQVRSQFAEETVQILLEGPGGGHRNSYSEYIPLREGSRGVDAFACQQAMRPCLQKVHQILLLVLFLDRPGHVAIDLPAVSLPQQIPDLTLLHYIF